MVKSAMLPVLFQVGIGFGGFQQMIQNMVSLGFFQFLFPFLLALAIFYGILKWVSMDDKTGKPRMPNSATGLISLVLGFFVMLFASANQGIVLFFQNLSGAGLMVGTAILFVAILMGLTGFKIRDMFGKEEKEKSGMRQLLLLLIVVIVIVLFVGAAGPVAIPGIVVGGDFWTIIFFVVILAVVLMFLGKGEEKKE